MPSSGAMSCINVWNHAITCDSTDRAECTEIKPVRKQITRGRVQDDISSYTANKAFVVSTLLECSNAYFASLLVNSAIVTSSL